MLQRFPVPPAPLPALAGPLPPKSGLPRLSRPPPEAKGSETRRVSGPWAGSRVCALKAVSWDTKGGEGGQQGRSPYLTLFPRICLGVNPRRVVTGNPPMLSNQPLLRKKATPSPARAGRARVLRLTLPVWGRTGPGSRVTRPLRSALGNSRREGAAPTAMESRLLSPTDGLRRCPRVTCPGGRGPEQPANLLLRPAARRGGRSLNRILNSQRGRDRPPPGRPASFFKQLSGPPAFVLGWGRRLQEEVTLNLGKTLHRGGGRDGGLVDTTCSLLRR